MKKLIIFNFNHDESKVISFLLEMMIAGMASLADNYHNCPSAEYLEIAEGINN